VDSLSVFTDAARLNNATPQYVERIDSKNSTWRVQATETEWQFFKYFLDSDNDLSHDHFTFESDIFNLNPNNLHLPTCLYIEAKSRLIVTKYLESQNEPWELVKLVEKYRQAFSTFKFGSRMHYEFPSSVTSLTKKPVSLSDGQFLVWQAIQSSRSLFGLEDLIQELWSPDVVVHGDLKLSNLLFTQDSLVVTDWESISLGPSGWDEAQLTSSFIVSELKMVSLFGEDPSKITRGLESIATRETDFLSLVSYWIVQNVFLECGEEPHVPYYAGTGLQIAESILEGNWGEVWNLDLLQKA